VSAHLRNDPKFSKSGELPSETFMRVDTICEAGLPDLDCAQDCFFAEVKHPVHKRPVRNLFGPTTIIEDGFDLAIHSGDLPDSTLVARRLGQTMTVLVATPQYLARYGGPGSPEDLNRFRSVVFVERGSVQPWSFGSGEDAKRVIPTGVFRTSDIEQMRMGVLEHLGIAQAPAWLFAAELREGTVVRLLTPFERTVPILAVRPASRRMSAKVRIFIEHLEKTFALCFQFNPRPG
jgi:DNA-binding transcriptional LysR family regulator